MAAQMLVRADGSIVGTIGGGMVERDNYEVWFVIGSQHLYGPETLRQVTQHADVFLC